MTVRQLVLRLCALVPHPSIDPWQMTITQLIEAHAEAIEVARALNPLAGPSESEQFPWLKRLPDGRVMINEEWRP